MWVCVWAWCVWGAAGAAGGRYSSRIVRTSAGAVRGVLRAGDGGPVEVFLGVRYAPPPARLAPTASSTPATPAPPRVLLADTPPPACPQGPPPTPILPEHLPHLPYINNTSEDCLFLNIYVPGSGSRGVDAPYPVVLWLGAPSFSWGSGSAYDGTVLAATHHVIVVTLNYRLGLLGFLTCTEGPDCAKLESSGGAGLEDISAAAHWVRHNAPALGGDSTRLYLAGHRHGAALAHHLLAREDLQGVIAGAILLSGSGLSPWASSPSPIMTREAVARALHCQQNDSTHHEDWLVSCVRSRPLEALVSVVPPTGRFLGVWPPAPSTPLLSRLVSAPLHRAARLLLVLTNTDGYDHYDQHEINHGFEEEHRNRILRTFVRNVYKYHRAEIYAAIRNEYTWWERPVQHPVWTRGATSDATSDGGDAAPATRAALTHAHSHQHTLFAILGHRSQPAHTPQRLGSASYESLWHFLGVPLLDAAEGEEGTGGSNSRWSRADLGVAGSCTALLARFVRGGPLEEWPDYTQHDQHYLHIGTKLKVKSHYRGHKMALWLNLIPQLHRPGAHPAHHDFPPEPDLYAGELYPEEPAPPPTPPPPPAECVSSSPSSDPSSTTSSTHPAASTASSSRMQEQYDYRYSPAIVGSVGAGCVLAALNLFVLLGLYVTRHREKRTQNRRAASSSRCESEALTLDPCTATPRKSSLKRSSELDLKERAQACGAATKKRVHIQEISV